MRYTAKCASFGTSTCCTNPPCLHRQRICRAAVDSSNQPAPSLGSLIPETLEEMDRDEDFQATQQLMEQLTQREITAREARKREKVLKDLGVPSWLSMMQVLAVMAHACSIFAFAMRCILMCAYMRTICFFLLRCQLS